MPRPKKQDAPASSNASAPSPPNAAADAFAKIEPELAALAPEQLVPITIEISTAVSSALAAATRIQAHRDAIAEELPKHPIDAIDKLDTYAQAAWYTHLVHTYASGNPESLKALVDEAARLREGLLIAAEALAHRGLLNADAVAKVRKGSGTSDTGNDLVALAGLFSADWGKVSSKTAVERHEVDRAAEIGPAVLVAAAARKQPKNTDTVEQRARAFTLLVNAYDSCRRALAYLRWKEGDADTIAPSLFKKKPGRKPGAKKEEGAETEGAEATEG